ncbi:MAG: hypothetical protein ACI8ZA_001098 [Gammaproteobacteria bacterium]|jgi:hypothetical protein
MGDSEHSPSIATHEEKYFDVSGSICHRVIKLTQKGAETSYTGMAAIGTLQPLDNIKY